MQSVRGMVVKKEKICKNVALLWLKFYIFYFKGTVAWDGFLS